MGGFGVRRCVGVGVVLLVGAWAVPVGAEEPSGGTVPAQVTMADPVEVCVVVDTGGLADGMLDFGVLEFGGSAVSASYGVESCADGDQQVFASGTGAVGVDAGWLLVDGVGTRGLDEFSVSAELAGLGGVWLGLDPALVGVLGAGETAVASHELLVPPAGSSGAGQTLSFEVQWIATSADTQPEPDPVAVNGTGDPEEADWCVLQFPSSIETSPGTLTEVYGQIFEADQTGSGTVNPGIGAQLGLGPDGSDPRSDGGWTYVDADYNDAFVGGSDDEYVAMLVAPELPGTYSYVFRFSLDGWVTATYCDLTGSGSNPDLSFDPDNLGTLVVTEP
jgi:hypothetical protein